MNTLKIVILLCLVSTEAMAADNSCYVQCPVGDGNIAAYSDADHFKWTNYDDTIHLAVGFACALVIGQALHHYTGLPAWASGLIGATAVTLFGVTKETMFDTYTSRTDIKTWSAGGIAGGMATIVLNF